MTSNPDDDRMSGSPGKLTVHPSGGKTWTPTNEPCQRCGALTGCCDASKARHGVATSLSRLSDCQIDIITAQAAKLADLGAAQPCIEEMRIRYCLTEAGVKTINIGAPDSVARQGQDDVASLVNALWRIRQIVARKP